MSSTFALSTLALLLFASSLVLVLPRIWQRREQTETNIDWLRLRQAELPSDAVALREEAALRLMEEGELDAAVALADRPRYTWAGQLMGIGLMVAGVWWLYQQLGGWEDVQIAGELASLEQATPEDVLVLIDRIELRAEQRQANADYALLLAEYHLTGNNPARAVPYFERLIEAGAASPEIWSKIMRPVAVDRLGSHSAARAARGGRLAARAAALPSVRAAFVHYYCTAEREVVLGTVAIGGKARAHGEFRACGVEVMCAGHRVCLPHETTARASRAKRVGSFCR